MDEDEPQLERMMFRSGKEVEVLSYSWFCVLMSTIPLFCITAVHDERGDKVVVARFRESWVPVVPVVETRRKSKVAVTVVSFKIRAGSRKGTYFLTYFWVGRRNDAL
jgi:hypothetical protein